MWLRVTMSYHKFSNLREIFRDLNWKCMDGIISHNFMDLPATATAHQKLMENVPTMENAGKCVSYTKQPARYAQHLNDVKKLVITDTKLDSFASHFAHHCKKEVKPTSEELRKMIKVKIIWQGNAISCMKLFGKLNCSLCMWERIEILHTICQEEWKIITTAMKFMVHADTKQGFIGSLKSTQTWKIPVLMTALSQKRSTSTTIETDLHKCKKYQYWWWG